MHHSPLPGMIPGQLLPAGSWEEEKIPVAKPSLFKLRQGLVWSESGVHNETQNQLRWLIFHPYLPVMMPNDCHFWDGRTWQGWGQLANVLVTRRITGVPISSFHSAGMPHRGFHGGVVMSRCDVTRSSQCFRDTSRTSSTGEALGSGSGAVPSFASHCPYFIPLPTNRHRQRYCCAIVIVISSNSFCFSRPPSSLLLHILMLLPHRRYGRFRGEFVSSWQLIYVVIININISKISKVNICPYSCGQGNTRCIGSLLQTRHAQVKRTPSAWRRCRSVKHRYIVERPGWESIIRGPEMFAA